MVNREQDVIDLVRDERISTEPLIEVFNREPFEESMLNNTDNIFDIDSIGHVTHATPGGSLVAPTDEA